MGRTIAWQAGKSTASRIKLRILVALMNEVEKGRQLLDQIITIKASDLVGGSGVLRHLSAGANHATLRCRDAHDYSERQFRHANDPTYLQ
ncbi:serine hydrolase [Bradyrhizobium sp. 190]|nr:serine hydrolase [Bradyrhizobium sp. 190]MCK1517535.1 serine hydrolase [Bradyrhizobium sp. 190]